jgi:hypothetical protein
VAVAVLVAAAHGMSGQNFASPPAPAWLRLVAGQLPRDIARRALSGHRPEGTQWARSPFWPV